MLRKGVSVGAEMIQKDVKLFHLTLITFYPSLFLITMQSLSPSELLPFRL